jgi:hypothetical protein
MRASRRGRRVAGGGVRQLVGTWAAWTDSPPPPESIIVSFSGRWLGGAPRGVRAAAAVVPAVVCVALCEDR